jgi:hypothetical protein
MYFVKTTLKNAPEFGAVALKNGFDWYVSRKKTFWI